jgi:hypothetical protein
MECYLEGNYEVRRNGNGEKIRRRMGILDHPSEKDGNLKGGDSQISSTEIFRPLPLSVGSGLF